MDPKLLAMLATAGHMMFADEPGGEGGSAAPSAPVPTPTDGEQPQGDPAELGEPGRKALAAERKRADDAEKASKALQAQIDQLNDSKLTETQRLQKQLEDLQTSYQASQLEASRSRVIAAEGIAPSLASFVQGADEAALVASAQALKAAMAEVTKPGTPAPDPSQGAHQPLDPTMHSRPGVHRLAAAFEQQLESNS